MKLKTSELTGPALDYAVCLAKGHKVVPYLGGYAVELHGPVYGALPPYCSNWSYGGPLIERDGLNLEAFEHDSLGPVWVSNNVAGLTPLEAACRAFVASKLGETVEIPADLSEAKGV